MTWPKGFARQTDRCSVLTPWWWWTKAVAMPRTWALLHRQTTKTESESELTAEIQLQPSVAGIDWKCLIWAGESAMWITMFYAKTCYLATSSYSLADCVVTISFLDSTNCCMFYRWISSESQRYSHYSMFGCLFIPCIAKWIEILCRRSSSRFFSCFAHIESMLQNKLLVLSFTSLVCAGFASGTLAKLWGVSCRPGWNQLAFRHLARLRENSQNLQCICCIGTKFSLSIPSCNLIR